MANQTTDLVNREAEMDDLLETAWSVIANAGEGDWSRESEEWQRAAATWRGRYHQLRGIRSDTTGQTQDR
jgi:hypothetical protein